MAAETGFSIEGTIYEIPGVDSFTMDENKILWDYTGFAQDDFAPPETDEDRERRDRAFKHPYFFTALAHIAYQREHPDLKAEQIRAMLGKVNRVEMLATLSGEEPEEEATEVPLGTTSEPDGSSPSGSSGSGSSTRPSSGSSGTGSETGSAVRAPGLARIGTGR